MNNKGQGKKHRKKKKKEGENRRLLQDLIRFRCLVEDFSKNYTQNQHRIKTLRATVIARPSVHRLEESLTIIYRTGFLIDRLTYTSVSIYLVREITAAPEPFRTSLGRYFRCVCVYTSRFNILASRPKSREAIFTQAEVLFQLAYGVLLGLFINWVYAGFLRGYTIGSLFVLRKTSFMVGG